ncbi:MAG: hypothetical protein HY782_28370 [Chloroflexi bacterium]|nr:hypothetical protein [Chloroflexota bacterium]
MTDSTPPMPLPPSSSDLELTIAQVQGVYAARVVSEDRELREVHIVASTARSPKRLVRDVETLVFVKHGVRIDYRKISLVQLEEQDLLRLPVARPEIRRVAEENLGEQRRVRVEIQGAGKVVRGEALERVDNPNTLATAARATISCIEQLVGRQMDVRLENATCLRLDTREIALVVLACLVQDREETFVGASFVGLRPAEAAARATLDALNRRILTLTTGGARLRPESD